MCTETSKQRTSSSHRQTQCAWVISGSRLKCSVNLINLRWIGWCWPPFAALLRTRLRNYSMTMPISVQRWMSGLLVSYFSSWWRQQCHSRSVRYYWSSFVLSLSLYKGFWWIQAQTVAGLKQSILENCFTVPSYVSDPCANLIRAILRRSPTERITLTGIRNCDWLRDQVPLQPLPTHQFVPSPPEAEVIYSTHFTSVFTLLSCYFLLRRKRRWKLKFWAD